MAIPDWLIHVFVLGMIGVLAVLVVIDELF